MMPVTDSNMVALPHKPPTETVNYKKKYKAMKRKMRMLVYEQECFMEELKKAQRKLLKVSRDRSFLLDRLLQYEKPEQSTSDSEATASSDSDGEGGGKDGGAAKRKRTAQSTSSSSGPATAHPAFSLTGGTSLLTGNVAALKPPPARHISQGTDKSPDMAAASGKKRTPKVGKKPAKIRTTLGVIEGGEDHSRASGHMTREELERHLEMKQSSKPQFMSLEKTPYSLPDDIFSHDNSNQDGDSLLIKKEPEDEHLIIDMPQ